MAIFYMFAIIALLVATAAIYMALIKPFPLQWLYYHYFIRKPLVWTIFTASLCWVLWRTYAAGALPLDALPPLGLMALAIVLTYRMHQEVAFPAVDFPTMADDPLQLPLADDMMLAIIDYAGVTRAYPLDYVVHHHIVNDRFGDRIVALTYCAMCRSIIPFDVTDIGPLYVASFKNANMVVADRRTKTFFQQATCDSVIGPLHPHTLTMIPFQMLPWAEVRHLPVLPQVCQVSAQDFREFQLPVPGVWTKIMASEATPGLPAKNRDKTFPARTHVIGVVDPTARSEVVYLKRELLRQRVVRNDDLNVVLVGLGDAVNAFKGSVANRPLHLTLDNDNSSLCDNASGTIWDMRGQYQSGGIKADLEMVAISDEYWFSWKAFHPDSQLIRLSWQDSD